MNAVLSVIMPVIAWIIMSHSTAEPASSQLFTSWKNGDIRAVFIFFATLFSLAYWLTILFFKKNKIEVYK
ncbi:hypothetical protein ACUXCC_003549 [Cytobacillus horneckiae]|uniref:hypothetical protein n=1 Tax=Cytobacillus horneckiae TaxID=549687 RepID=UPI0019D25583|nr:hypothetical protein [Cytobacillus horneckiae]